MHVRARAKYSLAQSFALPFITWVNLGKLCNPSQSQVPFLVKEGQKRHGFVLGRKWSTVVKPVQNSAYKFLLSFIFLFSLYFLVLSLTFKVKLNLVKQLPGGVWTMGHLETVICWATWLPPFAAFI